MELKTKRTGAFTLVEIMIVVAIIGVIIGIAMPAFMRAREVSRARACQENLAQIDGAMDLYSIEHKKQAGDSLVMNDLIRDEGTGYLRTAPQCPSGGTYLVQQVDVEPTCSIGANTAAPFAPHEMLGPGAV
jgi:prepilin-type N-terminal cleavage/methylation domain-containing protein